MEIEKMNFKELKNGFKCGKFKIDFRKSVRAYATQLKNYVKDLKKIPLILKQKVIQYLKIFKKECYWHFSQIRNYNTN